MSDPFLRPGRLTVRHCDGRRCCHYVRTESEPWRDRRTLFGKGRRRPSPVAKLAGHARDRTKERGRHRSCFLETAGLASVWWSGGCIRNRQASEGEREQASLERVLCPVATTDVGRTYEKRGRAGPPRSSPHVFCGMQYRLRLDHAIQKERRALGGRPWPASTPPVWRKA